LVDEIVVVDTGSSVATREIAVAKAEEVCISNVCKPTTTQHCGKRPRRKSEF
jgi:glycosyltransferase involved in cell wall biosynthesis